jgi:hypothetical protein
MSMEGNIMGIVPGLQATALVGENLKLFDVGKKAKKITPKKIIKTGVTNMVGIGMIGATAGMINKL